MKFYKGITLRSISNSRLAKIPTLYREKKGVNHENNIEGKGVWKTFTKYCAIC